MTPEDPEKGKVVEHFDRRSDSFLRDILDNLDQYAFGIITQHGYRELERKLNEHAEDIEAKFHRWFVRGLVAFGIMAICCVVSLVGFGVVLGQFQDTREEFIRDSCMAQNKSHDKTINKLLKAQKRAERQAPTAAKRERIRQSVKVSIGLIDALAPKQDCDQLVAVAAGEADPPPPVPPPGQP